ncbi:class I adenylate-forming enzyme family protein [Gordonia sp. LSe1-13]|uniref:Class I adenylate-forming enzyme family protein n=1 Tax=Gordonia sesuvii TaxID=3116777 RepID=A0ABU7MK51_9ACTN|nr:class I adenylate-forming enzyme family protein [Gordonia sp. LSe1-13]
MPEHVTILSALEYHADRTPNHEFVVELTNDGRQVVTYSEALVATDALAAGFSHLGVDKGDRVVIRMANSWSFIVTLLAALRLGAIAVPTIRQYSDQELHHALVDSGAKVLVFDDVDHAGLVAGLPQGVTPVSAHKSDDSSVTDLARLAADASGARPPSAPLHRDADALIFYTSGTTSAPKGVVLSHKAVLATSLINAEGWRMRADDRGLLILPLFHCNGMFMQLLPLLVSGATAVLADRFSASRYVQTLRDNAITMANLTAGALRSVLAQPESADEAVDSLRMITFGLPLQESEIKDLSRRLGAPVYMCYGLTESSSGGTRTPVFAEPHVGWQSLGLPQSGWDVAIADDEGQILDSGSVGEILLKGPGLMTRYWNREDATQGAFIDSWFRTGDLGYLDENGYLYFTSRKKDMLKPKGENVAASEIETVLVGCESVEDAAVIGVHDAHQEERIVAYAVPSAGHTIVESELRAYCASRLASFKVPAEIRVVDDLPRTSVGKINKHALREEVRS